MSDDLLENEEYISARNDLDLQIMTAEDEDEPSVYIKISGFEDKEEAEDYAETMLQTLPLLLFESTRLH
jgi:hypothetical protein